MGARRQNAASNLPEDSGAIQIMKKKPNQVARICKHASTRIGEWKFVIFQKRQLQRNIASASMVNLAAMANKRVGLGQILEEVNEMRSSSGTKIPSNADEYLDNLDDDEDEGGCFSNLCVHSSRLSNMRYKTYIRREYIF